MWRSPTTAPRGTATSDTLTDEGVAVESLVRAVTPTPSFAVGTIEAPDEASNARAKLVEDAEIEVTVIPIANTQLIGRFLGTATRQPTRVLTSATETLATLPAEGADLGYSSCWVLDRQPETVGRVEQKPAAEIEAASETVA